MFYVVLPYLLIILLSCTSPKSITGNKNQSTAKASIAWTAGWSHDDNYFAIGNDRGELAIYETGSWKKIKSWTYPSTTITRLEWNPKLSLLAIAATWHEGSPQVVQLYDLENDMEVSYLHDSLRGRCLSWNPGGEMIAYVGSGGSISVFDKKGMVSKRLSFRNPGSLLDLDWHPSKDILVAVEEEIFIIDVKADSVERSFNDGSENKGILSTKWHPSGTFFVTGDYGHESEAGEPSYLRTWNQNGSMLKQVKAGRSEYRNLHWSRDGKNLAAASDGLYIFNEKMDLLNKIHFDGTNIWGVCWNSRGDKILTSDQAGTIRVVDVNGKILFEKKE